METKLSKTGSQYIAEKPEYAGDLFNNPDLYWPRPDPSDPLDRMLQKNAEGYAADASRSHSFYKSAMLYCSMSGGYYGYAIAEKYPDKILAGSRRFMTAADDRPFMTIQRLQEVLGGEIMKNEVFERNGLLNQTATEYASRTMPGFYIAGPDDREGHLRDLGRIHTMLRGAGFKDSTFEQGIYLKKCLLEHERGIYFADHAWSRNACMEKAVPLAAQYGSSYVLDARDGRSYDIVDIEGRPVSIADQAWEDARHLVDVVERGFRSEPSATLLLSRFMHDQMAIEKSPLLDHERAHQIVRERFGVQAEAERMERLKSVMLPYLAERCAWPTLIPIIQNDPHLHAFWEDHVLPSRPAMKQVAEIEKEILSYVPRGGFDAGELRKKIEERRDPKVKRNVFSAASMPSRPKGVHEAPFDAKFDPKLFNDRNFARLGAVPNPDFTPDNDHLTFEQNAAILIVNAYREARRPVLGARTLLYLDDANSGLAASAFESKHNITDIRAIKTVFDPLGHDSKAFAVTGEKEHRALITQSLETLMESEQFEQWRSGFDIGNIVTLSDFRASAAKYKNNDLRTGIAADGPIEMSDAGIETCARRYLTLAADGLMLKPGKIKPIEARIISDALCVATGLVERPHEGGKFAFDFFMWNDYSNAPDTQAEPQKMDLGDLILYVGRNVKANLEAKNPAMMREHNVTMARLLEVYEMITDPGRRNISHSRDPKTGADSTAKIINTTQLDPAFILDLIENDPGLPAVLSSDIHKIGQNSELEAFLSDPDFIAFQKPEHEKGDAHYKAAQDDPALKAKMVQMMWAWMRAVPMYARFDNKSEPRQLPVTGHLSTKGMIGTDEYDLRDLHPDYRAGRDAMDNLNARQRKTVFGANTVYVNSPGVSIG